MSPHMQRQHTAALTTPALMPISLPGIVPVHTPIISIHNTCVRLIMPNVENTLHTPWLPLEALPTLPSLPWLKVKPASIPLQQLAGVQHLCHPVPQV